MITFNKESDENSAKPRHDDDIGVEIDVAQEGTPMESIIEAADSLDTKIEELLDVEFSKQHITKFHKGSLRSGMTLDFDGSIVILGDVNPGAQVKATGNILVLGALKGVAHAGALGEKEAYVFALNMNPVQLRINDIITRFPETGRNKNAIIPEYAYVEDGKVYVSTF